APGIPRRRRERSPSATQSSCRFRDLPRTRAPRIRVERRRAAHSLRPARPHGRTPQQPCGRVYEVRRLLTRIAGRPRSPTPASGLAQGAYVLADGEKGKVDAIVIATGTEVQVALAAREVLAKEGIGVRVVSMPCWETFAAQSPAYRETVLPAAVTARV